ncbi:hypothetical protein TSOC_005160, partial [Tetrabaena socialis]
MKLKNLDTGEEYELEEYAQPSAPSDHAPGPSDGYGSPGDEAPAPRSLDGKKKGLVKKTSKLKAWAKHTLSTVKERIDDRIELKRQQRDAARDAEHAAPADLRAPSWQDAS